MTSPRAPRRANQIAGHYAAFLRPAATISAVMNGCPWAAAIRATSSQYSAGMPRWAHLRTVSFLAGISAQSTSTPMIRMIVLPSMAVTVGRPVPICQAAWGRDGSSFSS